MPKRIHKYSSDLSAMFGPLRNAEGDTGGAGTIAPPKPAPPAGQSQPPQADSKPEGKEADEQLGENGKKALERERDARKALEAQMTQMRDAFASALGVKPDKADPAELLTQMQAQMTQMQHQATVDRVARESGLTDAGDLEFLASAKDEEQMKRFAERLKAATGPLTPKPDLSQGPQGGDAKPEPKPGVDRLAVGVQERLDKK